MELLRFSHLECHYGAREIFSGAGGVVREGERIGLVGPNGAGKSSLLRLLAGVEPPYGGTIARAKDLRLGYLSQSVADETQATLQELVDAALARAPDEQWGLRNKTLRTMLTAFGFAEADYERPLREFSGGQRAKAALVHVLIDEPDYFILDEPTNHLDIATVRWLEAFITGDKRSYVIVSHDRYFLDRVATQVWEIERKHFYTYAPSVPAYSRYVEQKAVRVEEERRAYERFTAERETRRATIAGLRATHTSSDYAQVRSREKQLARVETEMEAPPPAVPVVPISVRLESSRRRRATMAFTVKDVSKAYGRPLFERVSIEVEHGERLAIVGSNGAGKSTLLKILAGELAADAGTVRFNPVARLSYFAQNTHEQLDTTASAVDAVLHSAPVTPERARSLLGRMRISGDAGDKPIQEFSGGERRRIMLACLMARDADVLLLDEPTNDLDIASREALESVLSEYEGTIVVVSHDRYLLARLCERVFWLHDGAWGIVEGGYDAYESLERERITRSAARPDAERRLKSSRLTPLKRRSQLEAQIAKAEREVARIDARRAEIEEAFTHPELYEDRARVKALQDESAELGRRGALAFMHWESLHAELEALPPLP
jgi:ATP-binding cassette subfamily F protein 3